MEEEHSCLCSFSAVDSFDFFFTLSCGEEEWTSSPVEKEGRRKEVKQKEVERDSHWLL